MSSFIEQLGAMDDVEIESLLDKLSVTAPPPEGFEKFFNTRSPQEVVATSQSPGQQLAQDVATANPLKFVAETEGGPAAKQGFDMNALAKMFAGNTDKPAEPQYAPLPSPGGPSRVSIQAPVMGAGGAAGGGQKVNPLTALAQRIMQGR